MTTKLDEMWAAFEAHKPTPEYADAWRVMCRERTEASVWAAYYAAPEGSAAAAAAVASAVEMAEEARAYMVLAERYAQEAIDALREVKP